MRGLPCCSLWNASITSGTNRISIAARTAQPWRRIADHAPEGVGQSAAESAGSRASPGSSSARVGFSYGCAEFALKKPPPLVPSSLIASWEATGPIGSVCVWVVTVSVTALPAASLTGLPARRSWDSGRSASRPSSRPCRHRNSGSRPGHEHQREQQRTSGSSTYSGEARQVDPEVADGRGSVARETANQSDGHGDARWRPTGNSARRARPSGSDSSWSIRPSTPASWYW